MSTKSQKSWATEDVEDLPMLSDPPKVIDVPVTQTAVAVVEDTDNELMIAPTGGYSETPDLDASDVYIPKLRLANGLSAEVQSGEARPGQWVLYGFDPKDKVDIVVLAMKKRREKRESDDAGTLTCSSPDAKQGFGNPGVKCAQCPFSQPSVDDNGKYEPPACTLIYSYQCFSLTHNAPCMLEMKKTATRPARQINSMMATRAPRSYVITLDKVTQQNNAGRSYFVPTVKPRLITDEETEIVEQGALTL